MIPLRLLLVASFIGLVSLGVWWLRKDAADDALRAVEKANRIIEKRADEAEQNVLTCPPELWSRELRRCATKLH
jgi:hypothetical protein